MSFQSATEMRVASNTPSGRTRPGLPVADALDRVVDRRVHVLADQVDADLAAALERHVGELHAQRLLELDRDDLVLLGRSRCRPSSSLPSPPDAPSTAAMYSLAVLYGRLAR